MSQLTRNVFATPRGGCRIKDPNQKDVSYTGYAAEQLAGFDKTEVKPKFNPNRNYNDNLSRGNVGSNKI